MIRQGVGNVRIDFVIASIVKAVANEVQRGQGLT